VARHRALDLLRYQKRRPVTPTPGSDIVGLAAAGDTADIALDGVATDEAIALIRTLPPDQAEAILLRVLIGLDARAAGAVLGKRAGAVRTAAYRGLRELARRLEKQPQAAGRVEEQPGRVEEQPQSARGLEERPSTAGVTSARRSALREMR
jgi:RNA polymerase sigma-70 factor (ECF subfamily)